MESSKDSASVFLLPSQCIKQLLCASVGLSVWATEAELTLAFLSCTRQKLSSEDLMQSTSSGWQEAATPLFQLN